MGAKRYGIFVPLQGFVYAGETWGELKFTQDATKGALGKSFTKVEVALEFISRIEKDHKDARIAKYDIKATVEVEESKDVKAVVQANRAAEFAEQLAEYKELKSKYEVMTGTEIEKVSTKNWSYFKAMERKLLLLELI